MKLILDNGREFELIRIQRMEFLLEQEEPYPMPHVLSRPSIGTKGEDGYSAPLYKYKAFIIGGQLYAYKLIENAESTNYTGDSRESGKQ